MSGVVKLRGGISPGLSWETKEMKELVDLENRNSKQQNKIKSSNSNTKKIHQKAWSYISRVQNSDTTAIEGNRP